MEPTMIIFGFVALLVIIFVAKGIIIIRQAQTMVIERLGRFNRVLNSGINIIWPVVDRPREITWRYRRTDVSGKIIVVTTTTKRIDMRERVYDFARQNVITRDNVTMEIDGVVYFQSTDSVKAAYEIDNLPNAIEKLTQTTLRNVIGEMDLDQCLTSRDTINSKLRAILDEATDKWGVKVNRVELQDITPPGDIQEAMEKQMRAERDRRAAILHAEGEKQAAILEAEGVRQSDINRAEGAKRSAILRAEGEAEARIKVATAEAEAITRITGSISGSTADPANYLIAVRYVDTLKEMVSGKDNKVIYMPYEATGILSSIGGIREMLTTTKQ